MFLLLKTPISNSEDQPCSTSNQYPYSVYTNGSGDSVNGFVKIE